MGYGTGSTRWPKGHIATATASQNKAVTVAQIKGPDRVFPFPKAAEASASTESQNPARIQSTAGLKLSPPPRLDNRANPREIVERTG